VIIHPTIYGKSRLVWGYNYKLMVTASVNYYNEIENKAKIPHCRNSSKYQ
jgi:hypothetical protein